MQFNNFLLWIRENIEKSDIFNILLLYPCFIFFLKVLTFITSNRFYQILNFSYLQITCCKFSNLEKFCTALWIFFKSVIKWSNCTLWNCGQPSSVKHLVIQGIKKNGRKGRNGRLGRADKMGGPHRSFST